jgi:hypothetical protein
MLFYCPIVAYQHRTRYVFVIGVAIKCPAAVIHLDQGGLQSLDASPWRLGAPHNRRYQTVSRHIFTESMVQLSLSRPVAAHGLGET